MPSQAITDDVDISANDTTVIDTQPPMGSCKVWSDALKLSFGEPLKLQTRAISPAHLNHANYMICIPVFVNDQVADKPDIQSECLVLV
ncbi:MAG: hypothetical protein AAGA50_21565 [Pseudomonadota bacterium]